MTNRNTEAPHWTARVASAMAALLLLTAAPLSFAEKADRDKPVNLEADSATVDDVKKISIYVGNVVLTQGTLVIRGDKMVVTEDAEGFQHGTVYGNPASFKQKREGLEEYIEGWGQRIEYDSRKDFLELFDHARMKRNQDEARGNYISYDGKTEFFQVIGGKELVSPTNPKGRVRTVMMPKKKAQASTAPAATTAPAASQPPAENAPTPKEDPKPGP